MPNVITSNIPDLPRPKLPRFALWIFQAPVAILRPSHWRGITCSSVELREAYAALKRRGFRETVWQIVYEGQIGGLIAQSNSRSGEYHVRFYDDRIEAEDEIARWRLAHFYCRRTSAHKKIQEILISELGEEWRSCAEALVRPKYFPERVVRRRNAPRLDLNLMRTLAFIVGGAVLALFLGLR